MWRNTDDSYGLVGVIIHWLMAVAVPAMFGLGLWMVALDYYDPWYKRAPEVHKSIGILLLFLLIFRLLWRVASPMPRPEPGLSKLERVGSRVVHIVLYLLLFAVMSSGYLISTADGRPIDIFGLFQLPATVTSIPSQADAAGEVHLVLAIALVALAAVHALAALKHHFLDCDGTLLRMLGRRSSLLSPTRPRKSL